MAKDGSRSAGGVEAPPQSGAGIDEVLSRLGAEQSGIIPALQKLQEKVGYLPPECFAKVARHFGIPEARVFGVATFYAQFHLTRQGRHKIKICRGTACHVRGSAIIQSELGRRLGIAPGETTEDYKFTLERVACFGSCALAPVVVVDGKVYGRMTSKKTLKLIESVEQ